MATLLQTALRPIEEQIINQIEALVTANKDATIARLKAAEVDIITEIGALVIANVQHVAVLMPFEADIAKLIDAGEASIVNALGGPDEALYTLLLHELNQLKASGLF